MHAVKQPVALRILQRIPTLQRHQNRHRHYWKNMECSVLEPPAAVRGMTELQREAFRKLVQVPKLRVVEEQSNKVLPLLKKFLLKMEHLKPVRTLPPEESDTAKTIKEILLHPQPVTSWESLPTTELEQLDVTPADFYMADLELTYDNWRADEIFKYVLPADEESLSSYSRIGHIVHLNLRDHLLPYKQLIGDVIRDKVAGCRTVVNKASTIDNTYRNFQLELICGEPEYQVLTKENGITFEFDFAKVYWNPRLSTEHERIVKMLQAGDVLYDVFAGVGPFSVPAAKKRCTVLANDLNPESFKWLQHNAKRNKCLPNIRMFNKDGAEFIREDLKMDLLERCKNYEPQSGQIHITMNLPAMAVEFLGVFRGLFQQTEDIHCLQSLANVPIVHVYSFAKGEDTKKLVVDLVEKNLGMPLGESLQGVHFVRNVAPNKDMYRVSFLLTKEMLTTAKTPVDEDKLEMSVQRKRVAESTPEEEHSTKVKCS